MKAIFVVFLAVCAYGHAASFEAAKKVTARELTFTSSDQVIHRVGCIQANYAMMWHEAQLACVQLGFNNLLSIKSAGAQEAAEYTMAAFAVPSNGSPWIGLHRAKTSEAWTWGDGSTLGSYTNWYGSGSSTPGYTTFHYTTYPVTDPDYSTWRSVRSPGSSTLGGVRMWSDSDWGLWYTGDLTSTSRYCLCEG